MERTPVSNFDLGPFLGGFTDSLERANLRRWQEVEASWATVRGLLEQQSNRLREPLPPVSPRNLPRFAELHRVVAERFLGDCLQARDRSRPFRRLFAAWADHERAMQSLARGLPAQVDLIPREALRSLGGKLGNRSWRWTFRLLGTEARVLPLRDTVGRHLIDEEARYRSLESGFVTLLTRGLREIHFNWNVIRLTVGQAWVRENALYHEQVEQLIRTGLLDLDRQYDRLAGQWKQADKLAERRLARVLRGALWYPRLRPAPDGRQQLYRDYWSEQLHATDGELRLDTLVQECESEMLDIVKSTFESIRRDHSDLLVELDSVIEWLSSPGGEFPLPRAGVIPASSREVEILDAMERVSSRLPEQFDLVRRLSPKPSGLALRRVAPRAVFRRAASAQYPEIRRVLDDIETEQRSILGEIERAREVYAFGIEMSHSARMDEVQLSQEAISNAVSLLTIFKSELTDWSPSAEAAVSVAAASILTDAGRSLMAGAALRAARITGQEVRRTGTTALRRGTKILEEAVQAGAARLRSLARRLLVTIGWRPPTSAGKAEVVVRAFLPEEFTKDLSTEEIPRLYRHLFRFEPVEDPRLLIGRERELAAIAEARRLWETGRPVSAIIIGERGSGKTSLINGAVKRCLDGLDIVRSELGNRVVSADAVNQFVADLLGIEIRDVEATLRQRPRVVILEELERTFLRQIGGFNAVRALQRLVTATSASTFWIFCINEVAFRFLDGAVGLGGTFSHRVYAGTATRDDLREAIMVRHRLSGLRLRFPSVVEAHPIGVRLGISRQRRQGETEPETLFFDTLSEQSGGVYRTAFEIWLGHAESVQAGLLYMMPLIQSDFSPILQDLTQVHLFSLLAVMQHGGLTTEEHAEVFGEALTSSRARLDDLVSRQLLEPEPGRPGFRVRPEATRLVKAALYARNLL